MRAAAQILDARIVATIHRRGVPLTTAEVCHALGHKRYSDDGLRTYRRLAALASQGRLERWRIQGWPEVSWGVTDTTRTTHQGD